MTKGNKLFKLGENATLFVDPATGLKIAGNQRVEVTPLHMKSEKFKIAKKNNHIEEVDEDEDEETTDTSEITSFKALTVDEMKARILDEFEMDEAEIAEVSKLKKADLIAKYIELSQEAE